MSTILIADSHYFPCVSYMKTLFAYTHIQLEAYENYQKNSFRNRCVVAGSNGLINLSVPLVDGRDQKIPYRNLKIDYSQRWQAEHWRTIVSCYNKAPFFEYFGPGVEQLILERYDRLFDLNLAIMHWLKKIMKLPADIDTTKTYLPDYTAVENVTDLRNKWRPKNYQEEAQVFPSYFQMFQHRIGFQANLSILDLLFCAGPHMLFP